MCSAPTSTEGKLKRVPIAIASKHPTSQPLGDLTCPYTAARRLWCEREAAVPRSERAVTPFFLGPRGQDAVTTDEARDAIRAAASALDLDPASPAVVAEGFVPIDLSSVGPRPDT